MTRGARLRSRREALGWSLGQVAERTRIPIGHLEALEEDREVNLPAGPWATRYLAMLTELYGLPPDPVPDAAEVTHPVRRAGLPLRTVRLLATVSVLALVSAVCLQIWREPSLVPGLEQALAPPPDMPDQRVHVATRRTVWLTVTIDGVVVHDRETPGGFEKTFEARDEVTVTFPAADAVRLRYNGQSIVPLGRRTTPRTVRFVDDAEPGA
jgi:transcriptional regulator with XRE-family HTH domain